MMENGNPFDYNWKKPIPFYFNLENLSTIANNPHWEIYNRQATLFPAVFWPQNNIIKRLHYFRTNKKNSPTATSDKEVFFYFYNKTQNPQDGRQQPAGQQPRDDRTAQRHGQRSGPELLAEQQRRSQEHAGADHLRAKSVAECAGQVPDDVGSDNYTHRRHGQSH